MGDWPDKIFNMKTTWKYKTKLPTSKNMHSCTNHLQIHNIMHSCNNDLQIHNIIQIQHKS